MRSKMWEERWWRSKKQKILIIIKAPVGAFIVRGIWLFQVVKYFLNVFVLLELVNQFEYILGLLF